MKNNEGEKSVIQKAPTHMNEEGVVQFATIKTSSFEEDKILLKDFLANKENKKAAGEVAFQIQKEFPGWFRVPQLVKLFNVTTDQVAKQIEVLMLFNFCVGKVEKKIPLFKIDLDRKVQRTLLLEQIAEKEGEVLFLKKKLSDLD